LLGDILYAALVPYLGPDQALRQARPTPPPSSGKKTRSARSKQTGATSEASLPAAEQPSGARARHERWRENAKRARYEWMLGMMIDTFADRGYHQTSMNDIAARIGISRDTLRAHFGDKHDLFIAAHDWLLQRLANYVAPAYQQPGPWPQRISRALGALLTAIAYRPQGARVAIIEVLAAGPQAHQHHLAAIDAFTTYIDQGRNESPLGHNLPPTLARIVAGAAAARIHKHIAAGNTSELPTLHPQLLYLVLLPYVGHQQAQHEMQRPRAH
jgi:AcrR family transcriptional regulator